MLEQLRYMLKNHKKLFPDVAFDMRYFVIPATDSVNHSDYPKKCKYAACALGSAAAYPPFRKLGLSLVDTEAGNTQLDVGYNGYTGFLAAARLFGISYQNAEFLFSPCSFPHWSPADAITPAEVIEHVDIVIREYSK